MDDQYVGSDSEPPGTHPQNLPSQFSNHPSETQKLGQA
jgi:hypothetical protein